MEVRLESINEPKEYQNGGKGIKHTVAFRGSGFIWNYMQDKAVYTMQKNNKGDV